MAGGRAEKSGASVTWILWWTAESVPAGRARFDGYGGPGYQFTDKPGCSASRRVC